MTAKGGEFYDDSYWNHGPYQGYHHNHFHSEDAGVMTALFSLRGKTVLDIGCCFGYHMAELKHRGADVYGIDFAPYVIERLDSKVKDRIICGDINHKTPYPDEFFDFIYGLHVFEHLENEATDALEEIYRILKPGGYLLAVIPTSDISENGGQAEEHSIVKDSEWWKNKLQGVGYYDEAKSKGYISGSSNVRIWPVGVFVVRKPSVKTVTYLGGFNDPGAIPTVNRNLSRAIETLGVRVYRNSHIDEDGKLTDASLRYTWPPNFTIGVKHPVDSIIQAWEFGGTEALPNGWASGMNNFDRTFGTSEWVAGVYKINGIRNVRMFQHGVDYEEFNPDVVPMQLSAGGYRFLFVGGTDPRHGLDLAVRAFYDEFSPNEDASLIVKTDTNYPQDKGILAKYGGAKNIQFIHILFDEISHLYRACDCFVYPIRGAGGGMPGTEAMACGLPVIMARIGAIQEYAKHIVEIGYTIEPAKTPYSGMRKPMWANPNYDDLRKQMRWCFNNREEAKEIGNQASLWVRHNWTWERAARQVLEGLE